MMEPHSLRHDPTLDHQRCDVCRAALAHSLAKLANLVLGPATTAVLIARLRALAAGIEVEVTDERLFARRRGIDAVVLTPAELRVLERFLATGDSNQRIAEALGVSIFTVRTQMEMIRTKFGVHSRADLVARLGARGTA